MVLNHWKKGVIVGICSFFAFGTVTALVFSKLTQTVDAEGALWVALHGSGSVRRYMPDGRVDRVVRVPPTMVTCCAFGGPDLTDLYITTMTFGMSEEARRAQPLAGAIFRCRPGVHGRPPHRFAA